MLSGSNWGPNIREWQSESTVANLVSYKNVFSTNKMQRRNIQSEKSKYDNVYLANATLSSE